MQMPRVDLLFVSPPCQPFSALSKLDPDKIDRALRLLATAARYITRTRPAVVIVEMTTGGAFDKLDFGGTSPIHARFAGVLHEASPGYRWAERKVNPKDGLGVPQARPRWFFLGIRGRPHTS